MSRRQIGSIVTLGLVGITGPRVFFAPAAALEQKSGYAANKMSTKVFYLS
jgi:hypothetical protein